MADDKDRSVLDTLRDLGALGEVSQAVVEVEYVGHGKFEDFSRNGQKREVSPVEAERLLGLSGDDGPLFKKV